MKKLLLSILGLFIAGTSWGADEWLKTRPQSTDTVISYPGDVQANNAALDRVLGNYREGMTLTYSDAGTVSVTSGEVVCSNSGGTVRKMRQNSNATNVTFSDLDSGSEASSTTYYLYANCDADATTASFKISASSSAPTGITYYKRLGSFYNSAASNITYITNDNKNASFSSWSSKSNGVSYQASTDGFIQAYRGGNDLEVKIYVAGVLMCTQFAKAGTYSSCFSSVKNGDIWYTNQADTVYFMSVGN